MPSNSASGSSTPNPRFTLQSKAAEDLLSTQTIGLVALSDFRKRRAEALEQKEQDALLGSGPGGRSASGTVTPSGNSDGAITPAEPVKKRKRKTGMPKLSFGLGDGDDDEADTSSARGLERDSAPAASPTPTPTLTPVSRAQTCSPAPSGPKKVKVAPNASVSVVPKAQTKRTLLEESRAREALRKEFLALQERVKATEMAIPFVFYDGGNIPGGVVKVRKGDFVWVFLDGSRKVGAGLGVGGREGEGAKARREWARVGVDDLMLVRGEIIIPHHYDFYYFIMNRTVGPNKRLLFNYSAQPPPMQTELSDSANLSNYNPLSNPSTAKSKSLNQTDTNSLEGASDDPTFTKVVDRRWYERNKHIFPASVWQEFDPEKDYQKEIKRDTGGNAFFFS